MSIKLKGTMDRRFFLRGVGGAILALPHLNLMAAGRGEDPPVRMVCVGTNFGFVPQLFFPEQVGRDYVAPELIQELEPHRAKFTIFSQLDHGAEGVGGHGGVHAFLSGILSKNAKGHRERNMTVDQKAAEHVASDTRFASMQLSAGRDSGSALSWNRSGVALPSQSNLSVIYNMLFQSPESRERSVLRRTLEEKRSVLDLVASDAKILQDRVGGEDLEKLDQYFTSVRELERNFTQSEAWLDKPKPRSDYELPSDANGLDFVDRVPLYYDLMTLALQTDSTRVITLSLADLGANSGGFPITRGYHQLTHHGKVASYIKELSIIERFHTKQFGRFLNQLDAIREPNGKTLLDNTMTLLGSGMGNASSHSNKNLPLLLAGGGFKHGQHIRYEKGSTSACHLFVSMLQRFGLGTDSFNLATGRLNGLELA
jgi:hypothetical protein